MKTLLFSVFCMILTISCSDNKTLPADILPVNKMMAIIWDMEIADQHASDRFILSKDSMRMEATSLYQQVFAKHKITKLIFYKNFSFYEAHPDLLKTLFDSVTSYGNRQKVNMYKKAY